MGEAGFCNGVGRTVGTKGIEDLNSSLHGPGHITLDPIAIEVMNIAVESVLPEYGFQQTDSQTGESEVPKGHENQGYFVRDRQHGYPGLLPSDWEVICHRFEIGSFRAPETSILIVSKEY